MTLDDVLGTATPLIRRVDTILRTTGAPPDHAVWTELRRVRLLPGDAVHAVAALRPADLAEAPPDLQAAADTCTALAGSLPGPGEWAGEAAEAYDRTRLTVADQVSGTPDSLGSRLHATARLADSLITWMRDTQAKLAMTLVAALASVEAVALTGNAASLASDDEIEAAAKLASQILQVVGDAYDQADDLVRASRELRVAA
ncbi:hypothetical protein [Actinoplanes sp. TFC3]|uniref:hypothetical protein n=1 Tax=Actinoplanes sp. TFC3 TaxID=1710355 RepID=UPI000836B5BF|nr:hypothetical protein [Actinoplanes sp. TFC3]